MASEDEQLRWAIVRAFDLPSPPNDAELLKIRLRILSYYQRAGELPSEDDWRRIVFDVLAERYLSGIIKTGGLDYSDLNALVFKLRAENRK